MRKHAESRRADARGDQNDSGFGSWGSLANEIRRSPPALLSEIAFAVWRGVPQTRLFPECLSAGPCVQGDSQPKEHSCGNVGVAQIFQRCSVVSQDPRYTPAPGTIIFKNLFHVLPPPRLILETFRASMKVETGRPSETVRKVITS